MTKLLRLIACLLLPAVLAGGASSGKPFPTPEEAEAQEKSLIRRTMIDPVVTAGGAIARTPGIVAKRIKDDTLKMTEFFDTTLPDTMEKYRLVLDFSPRFGDLGRREFVRYPITLRYGLKENWELYTGLVPFSPNPIDTGEDHRWGPGMTKLGVKYDISKHAIFFKKMTLGFETIAPLGNPPVDLIDHYTHLRPFITASRPLKVLPDTTLLTTLSYDRAVMGPWRDDIPAEVVKQNITELTPGLLYMPGQFGGFVEYSIRHIEEPIGYRLGHIGKVGVIWDAPRARTQKWNLPGKWQFEIGFKYSVEEGREGKPGVSARVRCKANLKEVLRWRVK